MYTITLLPTEREALHHAACANALLFTRKPQKGGDKDKALLWCRVADKLQPGPWRDDLYLRYLGVLRILEEASPYVTEEVRENIVRAHAHAAALHEGLRHRVAIDRSIIEVV